MYGQKGTGQLVEDVANGFPDQRFDQSHEIEAGRSTRPRSIYHLFSKKRRGSIIIRNLSLEDFLYLWSGNSSLASRDCIPSICFSQRREKRLLVIGLAGINSWDGHNVTRK
jgi:hypothetical protein